MKSKEKQNQKKKKALSNNEYVRSKRRRKKRILNKFLCILLLAVAVACMAGIIYMGRILVSKTNVSSGASAETTAAKNADKSKEDISSGKEKASAKTDAKDGDVTVTEEDPAGSDGEDAENTENTENIDNKDNADNLSDNKEPGQDTMESTVTAGDMVFHGGFTAQTAADTIVPSETDVLSANSVLIDLSTDTIVAAKDAETRIYPASMTKILTILVAAEHITNLDDTFTMTSDITGYCLTNGCSAAGFVGGETIPVRELFYGTILPSGGEAAVGLATYVAGSQEAFVDLMNAKLEELGLSDTAHFTNCVGIYNDDHYCTTLDMAMILKAAVENDWCREVLSTHVYTTAVTEQNPEGLVLSNWFLRRIEDKDCHGEVLCAKTGFVAQSGDCAASYEISASNTPYICVTVNTYSSWRCIYDHVAMYQLYAK